MKFFVVESRHRSQYFECGWGNGYVLIPENNRLHGVYYDDIGVDVHGGLTYSVLITQEILHSNWSTSLTSDDIGKWCVGFDTAHYNDNLERWPKERVIEETKRLRDRLMELSKVRLVKKDIKNMIF